MRKIIVSEFITLDGVMQDPGGSKEIPRGGWNLPFMNEEAGQYKVDELLAADALLLGRVTYQAFAEFWPTANMGAFSDQINSMKKYVVSSTLTDEDLIWNNTTQIKHDVVAGLKKLKQSAGGPILVNGSAQLVQTLIQNDLVDEYRLQLHPIILGEGKRLFNEGLDQKTLGLVETRALNNGLLLLTYKPN
ncbi:MAG TPA: dihydrofolate reductase family protein [Candidatus Saccharimonadales bacterium]|nr:dihydrofolate reductase family protein [Candidatus Saccharimonadales bacterium]